MARVTPYTAEELAERKKRIREYNARPDVKARKREYQQRPEVKAAAKARYQRPDVKQKYIDRNASKEQREYMKQWRASERGQEVQKDASLRQRGFTLDLWKTLVALQGGGCAICRRPFDSLGYRNLHADHCHDEQKPRGLLCRNCNHAEGQIRKTGLTPNEYARRLDAYLADPPAQSVSSKRVKPARKVQDVDG